MALKGTRCRNTMGVFYRSDLGVFTCARIWDFTDAGFIYGGQDHAYRAYTEKTPGVVAKVTESPWAILKNGMAVRLDFENDLSCPTEHLDGRGMNDAVQNATATTNLMLASDARLTIAITGMGETHRPMGGVGEGETADIFVDSSRIAEAASPGGVGTGCYGGMGAIDIFPDYGISVDSNGYPYVDLAAGTHQIYFNVSSNDELYHWRGSSRLATDGAYFQFELKLGTIPA